MADITQRDANIRFPFAAANAAPTLGRGVHRVAVSGAAQNFPLTEAMRGKFLYFAVDADGTSLTKVQVAAAVTAQALAVDATTGITAGVTVPAGQFIDRLLCDGATHLCWIGDAAGGFVEFYVSERLTAG
jgi:hypothetical protein